MSENTKQQVEQIVKGVVGDKKKFMGASYSERKLRMYVSEAQWKYCAHVITYVYNELLEHMAAYNKSHFLLVGASCHHDPMRV